jgi:hypothetical protein
LNPKRVILILGLAVFAASIYFLQDRPPEQSTDGSLQSGLEAESDSAATKQIKPLGNNNQPGEKSKFPRSPRKGATQKGETSRSGKIDAEQAALLRKQLQHLFAKAAQAQNEDAGEPAHPKRKLGTMKKEYIMEAIKEISPLLKECMSLAQDEGTPAINGRLRVQFEISGDPELGGVIGASQILDGGSISSPGFRECVQETMYSIVLDAPEEGGMVTVKYPFVFQSAKPEAAAKETE